jgi:N-acetylglucosamine kinase-like BadF-type ATPase
MTRVLGVDGGNTKTLAVVADGDGRACGAARAGCGDVYGTATPDHALDAITAAARAAAEQAGIAMEAIDAAAFSLAGADWPEDFALLERALPERLGLRVAPLVVNDAMGALRAGSPDWTGVSAVAGTYSAVGARNHDGRVFHLGFWPDGCGGRDLAEDGLRAVYRAELGLGPPTALSDRALTLYGADDALELLHAFTRRGGLTPADADRFVPAVLDAADAGDEVAATLVRAKGRILGREARVCGLRAGLVLAGAPVVLTGGVFEHPSALLAAATLAELPGAVPVRHGPQPIAGAVLLALDRLGRQVDEAVLGSTLRFPAKEGGPVRWAESFSIA